MHPYCIQKVRQNQSDLGGTISWAIEPRSASITLQTSLGLVRTLSCDSGVLRVSGYSCMSLGFFRICQSRPAQLARQRGTHADCPQLCQAEILSWSWCRTPAVQSLWGMAPRAHKTGVAVSNLRLYLSTLESKANRLISAHSVQSVNPEPCGSRDCHPFPSCSKFCHPLLVYCRVCGCMFTLHDCLCQALQACTLCPWRF